MAARRSGRWLMIAGGALAGAVGGVYIWMLRQEKKAAAHPFPYIRNAGPEEQPDEDGRYWDSVDEASDESFPASDPPALR